MPTPAEVLAQVHPARIEPYRSRCGGSSATDADILALYDWNIQLTAAFQEPLGAMEIALRHTLDQQLRLWNTANQGTYEWLRHPASPLALFFPQNQRDTLRDYAYKARARRRPNHPRKNAPVDQNDVLAQVMMGSWAYLLPDKDDKNTTRFQAREQLWQEALNAAFPNLKNDPYGHGVGARVRRLHGLRNRVSHMENLLYVDINGRRRDMYQLVNAISPHIYDWMALSDRVLGIAASRPTFTAPSP